MQNKILKKYLSLILSILTALSLAAAPVTEAYAAGIPSPLGFVFAGTAYDMYPGESGGSAGTARWAMDDDGYFTITLEKTGTSSFYFTNAASGTQARFGGIIVAGGGGGGGGISREGGGAGKGGSAFVMLWAEPYWNDTTSREYGQFYNPTHIPSGWYVNDYLNQTGYTVTIGARGKSGRGFSFCDDSGSYEGTAGGAGGSSSFAGTEVSGGKGGSVTNGLGDHKRANRRYAADGTIYDSSGSDLSARYSQISFWGTTINIGKGGGSGGTGEAYMPGYNQMIGAQHGHDYWEWDAENGQTYSGKGNGGGGAGVKDSWGSSSTSISWTPWVYSAGAPSSPDMDGIIIIEGKADLVTIRVYKSTNDFPANRTSPLDTSLLEGFLFLVHCEEGYVNDFLIRTDSTGKGERGGLPLAHYTITEVRETDKMKGYEGYMEPPVYGAAFLNSLEVF